MRVQISSGQGPAECGLAVGLFYRQLQKEGRDIRLIQSVRAKGDKGYSSILFETEEDMRELEGSVLWICRSPFRPKHRRKNWFIDVSIIKEDIKIDNTNDIRYEVFRSSGKGGQNVNKVSTAIRAIHIPTGIVTVSMDQRSQLQNKKIAYLRLLEKIDETSSSINKSIHYLNWVKHNQIERGNPIRVYKGMKFIRII